VGILFILLSKNAVGGLVLPCKATALSHKSDVVARLQTVEGSFTVRGDKLEHQRNSPDTIQVRLVEGKFLTG